MLRRRGVSNLVSTIMLAALTVGSLATVMAFVEWKATTAPHTLSSVVDERLRRTGALLSVVDVVVGGDSTRVYVFNYGLFDAEISAVLVDGDERAFSVLDESSQLVEPVVPRGYLRVLVIDGEVGGGSVISVIVNGRVFSFTI